MFERPPHAEIELVLFKRFENVIVSPSPDRFKRRRDVMHCRDHDDGDVRIGLAQPLDQTQAVHFRHDHVAQDQIHRMISKVLLRQAAVADRGTLVALRFQKRRNNFPNGFFVVDNQYFCFGQDSTSNEVIIRQGTDATTAFLSRLVPAC